jgi:hypothetical protein
MLFLSFKARAGPRDMIRDKLETGADPLLVYKTEALDRLRTGATKPLPY